MADDATKTDARDRNKVAGSQSYEVAYLATKHKITLGEAQKLIDAHGPSRSRIDAVVKKLKG